MEKFEEWLDKNFRFPRDGKSYEKVEILRKLWDHQQAKIDKLEAEKKELVEALEKWQGYSDGAVLDETGSSMTEKDIYDYVEEVLAKIKSEGK